MHIQSFMCKASHYARKDSPGRKYLPSDLNIKKMRDLFNEMNHRQVTYSLYRSVFGSDFNLGFGRPSTDKCSTCEQFKLRVKDPALSEEDSRVIAAEFIIHRRRSRKFYDLLNEVPDDSVTFCFDVMENLVLPKTPIGQAYYSRQLYMYVFAVVLHRGRGMPQAKEDVYFYTWLESEARKDSNTISSAVFHCLRERDDLLQTISSVRLFSDSCYGQNKNINLLSMLCAFQHNNQHLSLSHYFPIRGHSFLPADRAFGRVEQEIRKKETIVLPEEYCAILQNHGTVFRYGKDWNCLDFKSEASRLLKQKRSFNISEAKILSIDNGKVNVKNSYSGLFEQHSLLKKGRQWGQFMPKDMGDVNCVKPAKESDVLKLLGEMGVADEVSNHYRELMTKNPQVDSGSDAE